MKDNTITTLTPEDGSTGTDASTDTGRTEQDTEPKYVLYEGNKHYPYTSAFTDEDGLDRRFVYHFRRPGRQHLIMVSRAGKDKAYDSQMEILVQLALPQEREVLRATLKEYLPLVGSFADEVFRRAGAGSVFGGK